MSILCASAVWSIEVWTHPNLAFINGMLGRFQSSLVLKQSEAIKTPLSYLKIVRYANAHFSGAELRKSMSCYIFTLTREAISWKSSNQTITASSTILVDFIACYVAIVKAVWLKKFIPRLWVVDSISGSLTIHFHNQSFHVAASWVML